MQPEEVLNHYRTTRGQGWPNIEKWLMAQGHEYIEINPDGELRKIIMLYTSMIVERYFGEEACILIWNGTILKMGHGWLGGSEYFQAQGLNEGEAEIVYAFLEIYRLRKSEAAL